MEAFAQAPIVEIEGRRGEEAGVGGGGGVEGEDGRTTQQGEKNDEVQPLQSQNQFLLCITKTGPREKGRGEGERGKGVWLVLDWLCKTIYGKVCHMERLVSGVSRARQCQQGSQQTAAVEQGRRKHNNNENKHKTYIIRNPSQFLFVFVTHFPQMRDVLCCVCVWDGTGAKDKKKTGLCRKTREKVKKQKAEGNLREGVFIGFFVCSRRLRVTIWMEGRSNDTKSSTRVGGVQVGGGVRV